MQRIGLLVLLLFIVWKLVGAVAKRQRRSWSGADDFSRFSARRRDHRQRMRQQARGAATADDELVECSRCGSWVPATRAVVDDQGRVLCSASCDGAQSEGTESG